MSNKYTVKGFPDIISKELEIPNLGEIMNMDFTHLCPLDEFYKNCNEYQRYLIDNVQFLGKTDKVGVTFQVQYLFPGTAPLADRIGHPREWHLDSDIRYSDEENPYRSHLLLTDCEVLTEFNGSSFELDMEETGIDYKTGKLNLYLSENEHLLTPKKMPSNRIVSFDSHPHRVVLPTKPQLRFMFRVVESNSAPLSPDWKTSITPFGRVGRGIEYYPSLDKRIEGKIILNHSRLDPHYYDEDRYDWESEKRKMEQMEREHQERQKQNKPNGK